MQVTTTLFTSEVLAVDPIADDCELPPEAFFEVSLPLLTGELPYPSGWATDFAWPPSANPSSTENPVSETISIPNGRPIYALIVSGYETNRYLDDMLLYNFATQLMAQGAYVHYAWWNNLLAPYMARPLHHSDSYPGDLENDLSKFGGLTAPFGGVQRKAYPAEDFQFVADAKRLLQAIRENNPSALIFLIGHSMGGGAVVHLAREIDETIAPIDLLAPIDPVNNRNYPWGGRVIDNAEEYYNWTRWRITRDNFRGFKNTHLEVTSVFPPVIECLPEGNFVPSVDEVSGCLLYYDPDSVAQLPNDIIHLYHTWQMEAKFPFDFDQSYTFGYTPPPGGSEFQGEVAGILSDPGPFTSLADPGGWPYGTLSSHYDEQCCPTDEGIAWDDDGHGEIVGFRGPVNGDVTQALGFTNAPVPLGVRVKTSEQCQSCPNQIWPTRVRHAIPFSGGQMQWDNPDAATRVAYLQDLEANAALVSATWVHRPFNPELCLVSDALIDLVETMNLPPQAMAGDDQMVACADSVGATVELDGSGSSDPDGDALTYTWEWLSGSATGAVVTVLLPPGAHCIELTVEDPSGHIDRDIVAVTITADLAPPVISITISLDDDDELEIHFSATDDCDESPVVTAVIEVECQSLTIETGRQIELECEEDECEIEHDDDEWEIEAPGATLVVTATDSAGNTSTQTVDLCSIGQGSDDDDDDDDDGDGDGDDDDDD